MRIDFADATGCPVPQFVVKVENETEQMLLKAFVLFMEEHKFNWRFGLHGVVSTDGRYTSFNFGLVKAADLPPSPESLLVGINSKKA